MQMGGFFRGILMNRKLAVICLDGGICSQINLRAIGEHLQSIGADVRYDFTWFEGDRGGLDCLGKPTRNFQMDRLFPSLPFPRASHSQIMRLLRAGLSCDGSISPMNYRPPILICNDPRAIECVMSCRRRFREAMKPTMNANLREWQARIADGRCAVHVRLGDMPSAMGKGGTVDSFCKSGYYVRAIDTMHERYGVSRFVFFSDEPDLVRAHILPRVPDGLESVVCDINDQRSGYLDLYLMCHARWLIGSQGSAALFARILSFSHEDGVLIVPKDCQHLSAARGAGVQGVETVC